MRSSGLEFPVVKKWSSMFVKFVWLVLILRTIRTQSPNNYEGEPCYHIRKKLPGNCTILINCKSALEDIDNQLFPQVCGLAETAPIVCCPTETSGYKSRTKCLEFSKLNTEKCHVQFDRSKNLTNAVGKEFPHLALLAYSQPGKFGKLYLCGGSLISERFVLTAATCLESGAFQYGDPKWVRLGDLHLNDHEDDADPQEIRVEKVFPHPDHSTVSANNDIALVKLARDVEFTPYVRPICLHTEKESNHNSELLNADWGKVNYFNNFSVHLQRVLMQPTSKKECDDDWSFYLRYGVSYDLSLCAKWADEPCFVRGHKGGSLLGLRNDINCTYDLVGVLSTLNYCKTTAIFSRASSFVDWIESIVWP